MTTYPWFFERGYQDYWDAKDRLFPYAVGELANPERVNEYEDQWLAGWDAGRREDEGLAPGPYDPPKPAPPAPACPYPDDPPPF